MPIRESLPANDAGPNDMIEESLAGGAPTTGRARGVILDLLRNIGVGAPRGGMPPNPTGPIPIIDASIEYALAGGLGPMLHRAFRASGTTPPERWGEVLLAEDLTAQVRHGNAIDTACAVVDQGNELGIRVTLLKGISTSDELYHDPHVRPKRDVDVLVPEAAREPLEDALLRRGFEPSGFEMGDGSCHGSPLHDPERRVVVEVHSALFPRDDPLQQGRLFDHARLAESTIPSRFHDRTVGRLSPELQLVYIASYWLRDLTRDRMHPSHLPPMFDAVLLLTRAGPTLDWDELLGALDNERAAASLYVLLSYCGRLGLAPSLEARLATLATRQRLVGATELHIIHALLDRYLVGAGARLRADVDWRGTLILRTLPTLLERGSPAAKLARLPWNVAFPPGAPDRYRLALQLDRLRRIAQAGLRRRSDTKKGAG